MASKSKKIIALLLSSMMAATALAGCNSGDPTANVKTSSGSGATSGSTPAETSTIDLKDSGTVSQIKELMKEEAKDGKITLKVWCSSDDGKFEKSRAAEFEKMFSDSGYELKVDVRSTIGEGDAGGKIVDDPENGADVFNFADDQLSSLVDAGAIAKVPSFFKANVVAENSKESIDVCTVDDTVYAYPKTSDNGYFLYYDKRDLTEDDVKSFDTIIAKSKEKGKVAFMNFGDAWYATGFFFTAGCEISYKDGKQVANLNTDNGVKAIQAMCEIAKHADDGFQGSAGTAGNNAAVVQGFKDGKFSAAVIGTWVGPDIKAAIGAENLGAAKLPTVLMDGKQKQLDSFGGYKLIGVNKFTKFSFSANVLAYYLGAEESQVERYKTRGLLPTNTKASEAEIDGQKVKDDPAFKAIEEQAKDGHAHPQGSSVSGKYWAMGVGTLGGDIVVDKGKWNEAKIKQRLADVVANLK